MYTQKKAMVYKYMRRKNAVVLCLDGCKEVKTIMPLYDVKRESTAQEGDLREHAL
jgi:hypothetical protein